MNILKHLRHEWCGVGNLSKNSECCFIKNRHLWRARLLRLIHWQLNFVRNLTFYVNDENTEVLLTVSLVDPLMRIWSICEYLEIELIITLHSSFPQWARPVRLVEQCVYCVLFDITFYLDRVLLLFSFHHHPISLNSHFQGYDRVVI